MESKCCINKGFAQVIKDVEITVLCQTKDSYNLLQRLLIRE